MYSNEEDQFITYNRFILNQLQANNQLNHNNQQQNVDSWKAQASFHPQCSQSSEEFSSPVPSSTIMDIIFEKNSSFNVK